MTTPVTQTQSSFVQSECRSDVAGPRCRFTSSVRDSWGGFIGRILQRLLEDVTCGCRTREVRVYWDIGEDIDQNVPKFC